MADTDRTLRGIQALMSERLNKPQQFELHVSGMANCFCGSPMNRVTVGIGRIHFAIFCRSCSTFYENHVSPIDSREIVALWNGYVLAGEKFNSEVFTPHHLKSAPIPGRDEWLVRNDDLEVHVFPQDKEHQRADCWCEPEAEDYRQDGGKIVYIHRKIQ